MLAVFDVAHFFPLGGVTSDFLFGEDETLQSLSAYAQ